ncbi:MAG: ABC transporter ATP-binding protein [Acidimicrobiia bacterium]
MQEHLVVDGVTHAVGTGASRRTILAGASLQVGTGELVAVMGPSGCGKSTLLHMVGGLRRPDVGSVTVDGVEISALSDRDRARYRRRQVGYVFQQYNLIDDLTVRNNVELPMLLVGTSRRRARRDARDLLDRLGLGAHAGAWPAQLSGGEQQRVAIARALATRRAVVLADEPTGALDSAAAATVIGLLRATADEGRTVLLVTHDPVVADAADRVVWMQDGTIHHHPRALAPSPATRPVGGLR